MDRSPKTDANAETKERLILNSIRAKVIFGFLILVLVMAISWMVVHFTVNEMNASVDRFYVPDPKLKLAEELFQQVVQLEQNQKVKAIRYPYLPSEKLLQNSHELRAKLDTLSYLLYDNEQQLFRVDSMCTTLDQWDRLFMNYLKLRSEMANNENFSKRIDELSELVSKKQEQDSGIVTTREEVKTTTFIQQNIYESDKKDLSFFERLFGKKPDKDEGGDSVQRKIVTRELNIEVDTVNMDKDSLLDQAMMMMGELKDDQQIRSLRLVRQEYALLNNSGDLMRTLLKLSHDIQEEESRQEKMKNFSKINVLEKGVSRYTILILVLFIGGITLVSLIFFDVSKSNHYRKKLKEAKEEAEMLSQARQRFLANMSHEIRTPLQSIIGFSEQLVRYREQVSQRAVSAIFHSAQHLSQVVNEVLDYSQIGSNKFQLVNEPMDMGKQLYEVIGAISQQCEKKGILFEPSGKLEQLKGLYFLGDAFRLKQILYNLLGNAVKFTDQGKVIFSVDWKESSDGCDFVFKIEDSGIGISDEDKQRIFNQFERINYNRVPQDGIGLGLSIVQALIQAKGGEVELTSQPGTGSTFLVRLFYPYASMPTELSITLTNQNQFDDINKIVVVDDDPFIRELCEMVLKRYKVDSHSYPSAERFLMDDWPSKFRHSIFLIDVRLPGMSGELLSKKIREKFNRNIRLIAMTAQLIGEESNNTYVGGFDDVLIKPFTEDQLIMVLTKATEKFYINKPDHYQHSEIPNLNSLYKMAGNDKKLVRTFIDRFLSDSRADRETLIQAVDNEDLSATVELIHRMAGRCGQIGAHALAAGLRKLEVAFRVNGITVKNQVSAIDEVIDRLDGILNYFSKEESEKL